MNYARSLCLLSILCTSVSAQELVGVTTTPHQFSSEMRWRRAPNPELGARFELFLRNSSSSPLQLESSKALKFDGRSAAELLKSGDFAWHDTPAVWNSAVSLPQGALTVLRLNGKSKAWGVGTKHTVDVPAGENSVSLPFQLDEGDAWFSAVTFLSSNASAKTTQPDHIVAHLVNSSDRALRIESLDVWLPESFRVYRKARSYSKELECFDPNRTIAAHDRGGFTVPSGSLPLGYVVLELKVRIGDETTRSLWAHLKVKREVFDVSGGWVASNVNGRNSLTMPEFRQTLRRMHINTAHIGEVGGFTDRPEVYAELPLKRFHKLMPLSRYDTDAMLPHIHAVEFQGEPQYGGGRPVPPQKVWEEFVPYLASRLPTSITLSEERTWRYYAGISDYPHYDAYRVTAPAADSWRRYDRWDGKKIWWGAPLETIGVMTRSLREQSRPKSIGYWSQGAHDGWRNRYRRSSPTPGELRSQAWHGLSNRITSLYWFNLSLKSVAKFPDLIEPITRVNREALALDEFFLRGDAFEHRRIGETDKQSWEICSIATKDALLVVVHDLAYQIDSEKRVFRFESRKLPTIDVRLPSWFGPVKASRLGASSLETISSKQDGRTLALSPEEPIDVVAIFVIAPDDSVTKQVNSKLQNLAGLESRVPFNPGSNEKDRETLKALVSPKN
ncbi:MAG: hypothetical protein AAF517_06055 [Planctomycetota bacterium]